MEGIRSLQQSLQQTYAHFHKVEEVGKIFGETQKKMGEKLDLIHKLLTQWSFTSKYGSAHKSTKSATFPNSTTSSSSNPDSRWDGIPKEARGIK
jgi:hypothetical protein